MNEHAWANRDKLEHPLLEVRTRALRSLQFKLQHGLLPPGALARDKELLAALLGWFQYEADEPSMAVALEVLAALARSPEIASQLLSLGADITVLGLALPDYLAGLADQLLADLYSSRRAQSHGSGAGIMASGPASYTVPPSANLHGGSGSATPIALLPPQLETRARASPSGEEQQLLGSQNAWCTPAASSLSPTPQPGQAPWRSGALALNQLAPYIQSVQLSGEDRQQVEDLVQQLQHAESEPAIHTALLQLRAGVLADMPVEGILTGTNVVAALLHLTTRGPASTVPKAALTCLHELVAKVAVVIGGTAPASTSLTLPIGSTLHQIMLAACAVLGDAQLHSMLFPLLADLAPLTTVASVLHPDCEEAAALCSSWRQCLAAIADALRLAMVAACTQAGIVPPEDWENGCLRVVVDARVQLLADAALAILKTVPAALLALAVPDALKPLLAALYSNPLTATLLTQVQEVLGSHMGMLSPTAKQRIHAAGSLSSRKVHFFHALQCLGQSPGITADQVEAAFGEVASGLPLLSLLTQTEAERAVESIVTSSIACWSSLGAGHRATPATLVAAVLAHSMPTLRHAAANSLTGQVASMPAATALIADPLVLGTMVTLGLAEDQLQPQILHILQQAASIQPQLVAGALMPWQSWLACYASFPAPVGSAVAGFLQLIHQAPGAEAWHQLQPQLLSLYSIDPAARVQAASQLFSVLAAWQQARSCPVMQLFLDPFSGFLKPAHLHSTPPNLPLPDRSLHAVHLLTVENVEGLIQAACSRHVAAETTAQALSQLCQVTGDTRLHALLGAPRVLARLQECILSQPTCAYDLLQPALTCLLQVLKNVPGAIGWFLQAADRRALPLLSLSFHPVPVVRQLAAELLYCLTFVPATEQWLSLQHQNPGTLSRPVGPTYSAVPTPFSERFLFPLENVAILRFAPNGVSSLEHDEESKLCTEAVQLWQAQQLLLTASDLSSDLAAGLQEHGDSIQPWQQAFVQSCLATVGGLDLKLQLQSALQQLQQAKSHSDCYAQLARISLLCCTNQGIANLAAMDWSSSFQFFICRPPLSKDDRLLWLALLPLLRRLLKSGCVNATDVLLLAGELAGGSGLEWLQAANGALADDSIIDYQLTEEVLWLCSVLLEQCLMVTAVDPSTVLATLHLQPWLEVLLAFLSDEGSLYSTKAAAGKLLADVAELLHHEASVIGSSCTTTSRSSNGDASSHGDGKSAGSGSGTHLDGRATLEKGVPAHRAILASLHFLIRHVLMPKDWWHPEHYRGKAVIASLLRYLVHITQSLPASLWAPAWAELGGTYWLSRAAKDQQASIRQAAFQLLAPVAAPVPTHAMLVSGWPECGSLACKAACKADECPDVKAAALAVVVTALSHPMLVSMSDGHASSKQTCTLTAGYIVQQSQLWDAVLSTVQDVSCPPSLLAASAHTLLQLSLGEAGRAWELLRGAAQQGCLLALMSAPLQLSNQLGIVACMAAAGSIASKPQLTAVTTAEWCQLSHAFSAAGATAKLAITLLQLVPESQHDICQHGLLEGLLATLSLSTAIAAAALPARAPPVALRVQAACWQVVSATANAAALILTRMEAEYNLPDYKEDPQYALPPAVAVATVMQTSHSCSVVDSCIQLLHIGLSKPSWAAAFLQSEGEEQLMPGCNQEPVGAALCVLLIERFLSQQQQPHQAVAGSTPACEITMAALQGLLAYSRSAKSTAIELGLHSSLLETLNGLATGLLASAGKGVIRNSKLQSLKQQRAANAAGAASSLPRKVQSQQGVAGGTRSRSSSTVLRRQKTSVTAAAAAQDLIQAVGAQGNASTGGVSPAQSETVAGADKEPPNAPAEQDSRPGSLQLIMLYLELLKHLAFQSQVASDALSVSGLPSLAAGTLWSLGMRHTSVMLELLQLVANATISSRAMRLRWVVAEEKTEWGLQDRILQAVLRPSTSMSLAVHRQACATLCCFLASAEGCAAALRADLPQQALRSLQDYLAAKDSARLDGLLQVLTALASQPDGQKALLRTTAPSGSMLEQLLSLLQHPAAVVCTQAALVLRNAALSPEAKAHFLGAGALQAVVDAMGAVQQPACAGYAAATLWALVSQGEKVKVALRRCKGLADAVRAVSSECHAALENKEPTVAQFSCEHLVEACEALAALLT